MVSGFQLFVQQGPQVGQAFALNKSVITIGREAGNDIVLESPQISRYHTRLTLQGGVYVVEDMGSTNGTFLNGQRVLRPTPATSGDLVGVGESILLKVQGMAGETVVERGQPQFVMPPPPVYAPPRPSMRHRHRSTHPLHRSMRLHRTPIARQVTAPVVGCGVAGVSWRWCSRWVA